MNNEILLDQVAAENLSKVLSWAVRKTGNRSAGEDLAQEVFAQFYAAATKAESVEKPENLLWKVAYYCWCNYLRNKSKQSKTITLDASIPDNTDYASEMISAAMKNNYIAKMRREILNLSYVQRESMIIHYLEGLTIADTAARLGTTVSAVTWHLFDARKKIKREIESMSIPETDYVYRPGKLRVGISGGDAGLNPDTKWINGSLIRQNLCLLCYRESKTIEELVELTGIPRPYLEYDLVWLVNREFMTLEGKKYATSFPIIGRRHMQDIGTLYAATRKELIDKIIDFLWSHEKEIRSIGFYGCEFPAKKLMWSIITMFISFVSRNSPLLTRLKKIDRPIRPDGGKYIIMAGDLSEGQELDPNGYQGEILWGGYCGIISDNCIPGSNTDMYYWLGVNCFAGEKYHPDIVHADGTKRSLLHWIYTSTIEPWFSEDKLEPHGKEALAEAIADGLIVKDGNQYKPNFVIFTAEQIEKLREDIFRPLMEDIESVLSELGLKISAMHKADFPKITKSYVDYHTYVDLWDFGIYTLMYAAYDGKLWMPENPEQGTPLTLVMIK